MSLGMYAREISAVAAVLISLLVVNLFGSLGISSELKVRVRLSDGQIAEEILEADSEKDSITVEFKQGDGTYITVVFDFKRKNPHLVHMAEERRGVEHLHMDMVVNVSRTGHLNTLIHNLCKEAHEGFYTRTADTKHWLDEGIEAIEFEPLPQTADAAGLQRCPSTLDMWQPCICSYFLRLEWLPCMLKYCRSLLAVAGRANPYKCGIRSCSKGYRFDYYVPHRQLCPWDEET
ncbi:out at first protein homolog isoform X3 [Coregonus clupeaformis]|uniref:out at first protein homolog isoform X3 n=1 Tax=Coregonus clupeaformis TaxID=59861 RepID=UPI001E1C8D6D|nr:out at first protein homolog isoform X3 [Coregonus clupeaformis]